MKEIEGKLPWGLPIKFFEANEKRSIKRGAREKKRRRKGEGLWDYGAQDAEGGRVRRAWSCGKKEGNKTQTKGWFDAKVKGRS